MKKLSKKTMNIIYTIGIFILFLIISISSPLMGDDWGNYINGAGGIIGTIKYAIFSYQTYEGRFASRIFINILTYNKVLWDILTPIIIMIIYYLIIKILNAKDKYISLALVFLSFLLVDEEAFRQVYVWLAGNITYFYPLLTVFYLIYLNKNLDFNNKKSFILPILTLITSTFVENLTVCIVGGHIFYLIYYYLKNKKINISLLISCIFGIAGLLVMILSRGTMNRLNEYPEFAKMNIINKCIYNIPNFINYTFIRNSFLIFLITCTIILLTHKNIKNRFIKYMVFIYLSIIPLFTAFINYIKTFGINISKFNVLLNENNIYVIIFWIGYILIAMMVLFIYYKKNKDIFNLSIIIIGLLGNLSMMISPLWGGRTAYATTILLSIGFINILKKFKFIQNDNKYIAVILNLVLSLFIIFFLYGYISICRRNQIREEYIKEQLENNKEEINVIILSERFLWNPNPWGGEGYLAMTFKYYYNIPDDKNIKLVLLEECDLNER